MRQTLVAVWLALALAACGGNKSAAGDESGGDDEAECATKADCGDGERCRGGACVDGPSRLKSNNPTAEGVKRDVERHQKRHSNRVDRSLDIGD